MSGETWEGDEAWEAAFSAILVVVCAKKGERGPGRLAFSSLKWDYKDVGSTCGLEQNHDLVGSFGEAAFLGLVDLGGAK